MLFLTQSIVAVLVVCVAATALAACRTIATDSGPLIVQPGAPGDASRVITAEEAADLPRVQYTAADVRFVQGMIAHHAQAVEMTALLPSRTSRDDMRLLARRIEISQADEIKMMQDWLSRRGQQVPDAHAHHAPGAMPMPGMLTADDMRRLAEASGDAFDRLFLELMIKHHEGALIMIDQLFSAPGAGQEPEIFTLASDIDADQRMEIQRMRAMLREIRE